MACGLPPVAVDAHGPPTIVEDGRTGWLVPPDDGPALTEALVQCLADPAERARRGEAAYRASRSRYAWPALARGVARAYESAARREGRPAPAPSGAG